MTLLLALLGLTRVGTTPAARRMAWMALATLLFALGSNGPVYEWIHRLVPGVSYFRAPSRALFLTTLAVSVLAAYGVDRLREPLGRWWRGGLLAFGVPVALACFAAALLVMGGLSDPERFGSLGASRAIRRLATSPLDWLVPGLALGTLSLAVLGHGGRRGALGLATILVAVEAIACAHTLTATIDGGSLRVDSPLLATLKERAGSHRVMARQVVLSDREAWDAGCSSCKRTNRSPPERRRRCSTARRATNFPSTTWEASDNSTCGNGTATCWICWGFAFACCKCGNREKTCWVGN